MLRVVLGGLLAAVVVTVYLLASWLLIGTHRPTHKPLPEEWGLVSENGNLLVTDGVYVSVPLPTAKLSVPVDQQIETLTSFRTACKQGPLITVFYRKHGIDPLRSLMPVKILLVNLAAAWVAAVVLYLGQISFAAYFQRVLVVVLLGVFAGLTGHGWEHAWLSFDLQFSLLMGGHYWRVMSSSDGYWAVWCWRRLSRNPRLIRTSRGLC